MHPNMIVNPTKFDNKFLASFLSLANYLSNLNKIFAFSPIKLLQHDGNDFRAKYHMEHTPNISVDNCPQWKLYSLLSVPVSSTVVLNNSLTVDNF